MTELTYTSQTAPPEVPLERGEQVLYIEDTIPKLTAPLASICLIGFFGFPFYGWLFFLITGGFLGGVELSDLLTMAITPASTLTAIVILSALAPILLKPVVKAVMPDLCQLVITNKRIFQLTARLNKLTGRYETPSIVSESRYDETVAISLPQHGGNKFLAFKLVHKPDEDGEGKSFNTYGVANAEKVYSRLPIELRQEKGIKSKEGMKYAGREKRNQLTASLAGLLILGGLVYLSSIMVPQEVATQYLRDSRTAYLHGDYETAESAGEKALAYLKKCQSHPFAGPINYRLGIAYKKNGKYAQAIPLLKEATLKCDWDDSESRVNWRPAIFRSNIYLGEMYAALGKNAEATSAFNDALKSMQKETSRKKVESYSEIAVKFYSSQGDHAKAAQFLAAAHRFRPLTHHIPAFDQ